MLYELLQYAPTVLGGVAVYLLVKMRKDWDANWVRFAQLLNDIKNPKQG